MLRAMVQQGLECHLSLSLVTALGLVGWDMRLTERTGGPYVCTACALLSKQSNAASCCTTCRQGATAAMDPGSAWALSPFDDGGLPPTRCTIITCAGSNRK